MRTSLDVSGIRVVASITVEAVRELGIEEGTELVALVEDEAVVLVPRSAIKSRLRSMFADVSPSMRQELLDERRAEAVRESSPGG